MTPEKSLHDAWRELLDAMGVIALRERVLKWLGRVMGC